MIVIEYLWIAIVFVTMISILVAAHELGHYLFARLFNMGCEEFAVGFGKPVLLTYMRRKYRIPLEPGQDPMLEPVSHGSALEGGDKPTDRKLSEDGTAIEETTDFTIRPWPVGGFVRIKGMMPEEDGSETNIPGGFYNKPPWQRLIVLFAGPAFSVIAGILVLVPLFMYTGMEKPVNEPVLGVVNEKGPAGQAGLKEGDRILSIEGQPVRTFFDIIKTVRESPQKPLEFVFERKGETLSATVVPFNDPYPTFIVDEQLRPTPDVARQGKFFAGWQYRKEQMAFGPALAEAMNQPVEVVKGIGGMLVKPDRIQQQVSGPGTIVSLTGQAAKSGIDKVLWLAAMLSISVGIMNLLPIPPLDGGQMVIAFAEMLRGGKRLSLRMQNLANLVGVAMVFALMVGAISIDIKRRIEEPKREAAIKKQLEGKDRG